MWRFSGYFRGLLARLASGQRTVHGRERIAEPDFHPGIFRHDPARRPTEFLAENLKAGRGCLKSISATRRIHGERFFSFDDAYPVTGSDTEVVWEAVRQADHPEKPSRRGAFILLDCADWLPPEWSLDPMAFRCRIVNTSRIHCGDRNWFGRRDIELTEAAAGYWSGMPVQSREPAWEYVVDGEIYVVDWDGLPEVAAKSLPPQPSKPMPEEQVICPACGIKFMASPPASTVITTADRPRCIVDPSLPLLSGCPNVEPLIAAAWERLNDSNGRQE